MKPDLDIILNPDIRSIFARFQACFGCRVVLLSIDGRELVTGTPGEDSPFCGNVHELRGEEKCLIMDAEKRRECVDKGALISYRCHAGIEEAIAPLRVNGRLAGFMMIGQFRSTREIDPKLESEWRKERDAAELRRNFENLPYFPPSRVEDIVGLFQVLVDYVVTKEMVSTRGDAALWRIISHLKANLHRTVPLAEAARLIERSESTVSHLFQRTLGKSFKRSSIELKLEQAENYFKTMPNLSIQEVADRLGFEDPFYFSRIFKKHRGAPPSEFKKKLDG